MRQKGVKKTGITVTDSRLHIQKITIVFLLLITIRFTSAQLLVGPTSGGVVTLKKGRLELSGSNISRACRPSGLEFSVVFSETRINMG